MNRITTKLNLRLVKNLTFLFILGFLIISCDSNEDGFSDANGDAAKKYVTKIITQDDYETTISEVNYTNEGKVTSVSSDNNTRYFLYNDNGDLKDVSGEGDNIATSEVIGEIQDAYEIGNVLQYDEKGNPTVLELYDEDYNGNQIINIAHLTYDDNPFTFYYTLDAAGIIDVLYDVRIQFYAPKEIIMAKKLLPVNNPIKAVITDESNQEVQTISVNYVYDEDNYPKTASVVSIDDNGNAESFNVIYQYK